MMAYSFLNGNKSWAQVREVGAIGILYGMTLGSWETFFWFQGTNGVQG